MRFYHPQPPSPDCMAFGMCMHLLLDVYIRLRYTRALQTPVRWYNKKCRGGLMTNDVDWGCVGTYFGRHLSDSRYQTEDASAIIHSRLLNLVSRIWIIGGGAGEHAAGNRRNVFIQIRIRVCAGLSPVTAFDLKISFYDGNYQDVKRITSSRGSPLLESRVHWRLSPRYVIHVRSKALTFTIRTASAHSAYKSKREQAKEREREAERKE